MTDETKAKTRYPTHGWGALAQNPWLEIGPNSEEHREVLRRIWRRQGGDEASFDLILPARRKDAAPQRSGQPSPASADK